MEGTYVPVARFLPHAEAWPMAGRLRADGIDARVVRQPQGMIPEYQPTGSTYMVLVPEADAARAIWILEGVDASADDERPGHSE